MGDLALRAAWFWRRHVALLTLALAVGHEALYSGVARARLEVGHDPLDGSRVSGGKERWQYNGPWKDRPNPVALTLLASGRSCGLLRTTRRLVVHIVPRSRLFSYFAVRFRRPQESKGSNNDARKSTHSSPF